MTKTKFATLTAVTLAIPAIALAEIAPGDVVGITDDEISAVLTAQGYVIDEIEREDGELEVEATLEGVEYELKLDAATGEVLEVEAEDTDDDEDDEDGDNEDGDTQKG